jgi:DNA-binding winged helix-turn-helix (wHTH) protein
VTPREWEVVRVLSDRAPSYVSTQELCAKVWGGAASYWAPLVIIFKIRRKLPKGWRIDAAPRGKGPRGYRLVEPA